MVDSNWSNWTQMRHEVSGQTVTTFCEVSHLSRPDLNVEVVPFVGDLQDLWPGEPVDPQSIPVDQQAAAAHAQHNGHALRVLHTTQHDCPEPQPNEMSSRT